MSHESALGTIHHPTTTRKTDFLYRLSLKGLVRNEQGEVLVVKETDRQWWDLPGGGMDHHEDLKAAIAREMKEEVNLEGGFTYRILAVDNPSYLESHDFWQVRLIFEVTPESMLFSAGEDGDEVAFMNPKLFINSESETERKIYEYTQLARWRTNSTPNHRNA